MCQEGWCQSNLFIAQNPTYNSQIFLCRSHAEHKNYQWKFHNSQVFPCFTHYILCLKAQPDQQLCTELVSSTLTLKMTRDDHNLSAACFVINDDFVPAANLPLACEDTILCDQTERIYVFCELTFFSLYIYYVCCTCEMARHWGTKIAFRENLSVLYKCFNQYISFEFSLKIH